MSNDTFLRPDQSGWGTASDGTSPWTLASGLGTLSISGNEGQITGNESVQNIVLAGTETEQNADVLVRFARTSGVNDWIGLVLRSSSNGQNGYYAVSTSSALRFYRNVSGTNTQLVSIASTPVTAFYWMRFRIASPLANGANPTLFLRVWPDDGSSEPVYWHVTYQDTSGSALGSAGQFGVYAWGNDNSSVIQVDHFSAGALVPRAPNFYGAAQDSSATPNSAGNLFSSQNMITALLDSGATTARYQIQWWGIERAVQTTSSTAVSSTGSHTISVATAPANFVNGASLLIDTSDSGVQETVTITSISGTSITATFASTHTTVPYPVAVIPQAGDTPSNCGSPPRVQPYDWSRVDDYVVMGLANRLSLIFTVQNPPAWHQVTQACDSNKVVANPTDVPAFLTALLSRYPPGTFYALEAANEGYNASPPCSAMFTTQMLPLVQACRTAIAAYSPTTLLGAPAELDLVGTDITTWFSDFYAAGCQTSVDYLTFHYYNGIYGPDAPQAGEDSFTQVWQAIHAVQVASNDTRPIWLTEVGWDRNLVSDATAAGYISSVLSEAYGSGVIAKVLYYGLGATAPGYDSSQDFSGASYTAWKSAITLATPLAITSAQRALINNRLNYMNPPILRTAASSVAWWCPAGVVGTYNFTSAQMVEWYQVFENAQAQGYQVIVAVNSPAPFTLLSSSWCTAFADLIDYLINTLGYSCIKYVSGLSEPDTQ